MANQENHNYKSRRLSEAGKTILTNIIPALKTLKVGKTLLIQDISSARIDQVRSHLYTYFSETSQKRYFRTVRESATTLRIICQDLTPPLKLTFEHSPIEAFVIDNLLSCETLNEAEAITRSALTAGEITDEEFLAILEEWQRKIGSSATPQVVNTSEFEKTSIDPLNGFVEGKGGRGEND